MGRAYDDFDAAITGYAGTACYRETDFGSSAWTPPGPISTVLR
jgi:hypothetical protein